MTNETTQETWKAIQRGKGYAFEIQDADGNAVAQVATPYDEERGFSRPRMDLAEQRARRIAALPQLERALLGLYRESHACREDAAECAHCVAAAALRLTGVLP